MNEEVTNKEIKEDMITMLKSAQSMSEIALSTNKSLLIIITAILKRKYVKYKETRTKDMDSENIIKRY